MAVTLHKNLPLAEAHVPADHNHTASGDGGSLAGALISNYLAMTEGSAPATPAAGKSRLWARTKELFLRTSDGVDRKLWTPEWMQLGSGKLVACYGDCDPKALMNISITTLSPTTLSNTVARCMLFRPPFAFAPAHLYVYGRGTVAASFTFAIYPFSAAGGGSKVWDSGAVDFTANTWTDITGAGTPALNTISLTANTDYLICVTAATASATAVLQVPSGNPQIFGADTAPFGALGIGIPHQYGIAVTAGAFPGTQPAVAAPASTTANGPMVWMTGTSS